MRPKKCILFVDALEQRMSSRRFVLSTLGFDVRVVETIEQALAFDEKRPDVVAVCWPTGPEAVDRLCDHAVRKWDAPTILIAEALKERPFDTRCAKVLLGNFCAAQLVEAVKVMSIRKRGPRRPPLNVRMAEFAARRIA